MTDSVASHNTDLSSWDTVYSVRRTSELERIWKEAVRPSEATVSEFGETEKTTKPSVRRAGVRTRFEPIISQM
jgi:hypothetical protein